MLERLQALERSVQDRGHNGELAWACQLLRQARKIMSQQSGWQKSIDEGAWLDAIDKGREYKPRR